MVNKSKSIWFIFILIQIAIVFVLSTACQTGDDDDNDAVQDSDDIEVDGDGDIDTAITTTAKEGEECISPALLFMMQGVCQKTSDPCEGGYPDAFDIADIAFEISRIPAPGLGPLPDPPDAVGNCESDLVCCLNTDECEHFDKEVKSYPMVSVFFLDVACVPEDTCAPDGDAADDPDAGSDDEVGAKHQLELGCPTGQECCITTLF
ncbi:MAG: hypothetical protein GY847_16900 [Proteobacteria bacterium]|nr:hypothetical protein [Pseudomonadota bacterium]